ncbi:hypothetical protein AWJ20_2536 [Sugiyamaella lignohabitans]|uniref:Uncharacterized protein n=1 Tax=Sugiyamaella lignohabitans TaxID=796027 RepID=A0A167F7T2_9ASCO|nr:uncharacterized protein AWJ20_2536 [Sugiyamaella lignohabitans]ANB14921.1 hypothetical protein AWJ20_2536 [Sugiyamaella lignohabitans]
MKLSFPPFTRACVICFVSLSVGVLGLRYSLFDAVATRPADGEKAAPHPKMADISIPYITLVPGQSIVYPWVLLLSSFVEQSIAGFIITGLTLAFGGRYCERVWGSKHLAIFLAIQSVIPNLVCWISIYTSFVLSGRSNEGQLFQTVNGGIALQLGFLVAFKQLVPEHTIVLFKGLVKVQVKYLVMPVLVTYTIFGAVTGRVAPIVLCWNGFLVAWVYLRFYKVSYTESVLPLSSQTDQLDSQLHHQQLQPRTKIRGDASDTFALAKFFYPRPLTGLVASVSNLVFTALVSAKICTPFNDDEVEASNFQTRIRTRGTAGPAARSELDSDRRRALALRELGSRLEQSNPPLASPVAPSQPTLRLSSLNFFFFFWSPLDLTSADGNLYSITLHDLEAGKTYMYKYVIDGNWTTDSSKEIVRDSSNNENHSFTTAELAPSTAAVGGSSVPPETIAAASGASDVAGIPVDSKNIVREEPSISAPKDAYTPLDFKKEVPETSNIGSESVPTSSSATVGSSTLGTPAAQADDKASVLTLKSEEATSKLVGLDGQPISSTASVTSGPTSSSAAAPTSASGSASGSTGQTSGGISGAVVGGAALAAAGAAGLAAVGAKKAGEAKDTVVDSVKGKFNEDESSSTTPAPPTSAATATPPPASTASATSSGPSANSSELPAVSINPSKAIPKTVPKAVPGSVPVARTVAPTGSLGVPNSPPTNAQGVSAGSPGTSAAVPGGAPAITSAPVSAANTNGGSGQTSGAVAGATKTSPPAPQPGSRPAITTTTNTIPHETASKTIPGSFPGLAPSPSPDVAHNITAPPASGTATSGNNLYQTLDPQAKVQSATSPAVSAAGKAIATTTGAANSATVDATAAAAAAKAHITGAVETGSTTPAASPAISTGTTPAAAGTPSTSGAPASAGTTASSKPSTSSAASSSAREPLTSLRNKNSQQLSESTGSSSSSKRRSFLSKIFSRNK